MDETLKKESKSDDIFTKFTDKENLGENTVLSDAKDTLDNEKNNVAKKTASEQNASQKNTDSTAKEKDQTKQRRKRKKRKKERDTVKNEIRICFQYLKDVKSAKNFVHIQLKERLKVIKETSAQKDEVAFEDYFSSYEVVVEQSDKTTYQKVEKWIFEKWLAERQSDEDMAWLTVNQMKIRSYDASYAPCITVPGIKVLGGCMLSPNNFSKHWEWAIESEKVAIFEHDKEMLSLETRPADIGYTYDVIEIPYSSMHETIICRMKGDSCMLAFNTKSNPKLYNRKKLKDNRVEDVRKVEVSGTDRRTFGLSGSFAVEMPVSHPSSNTSGNKSSPPIEWQIISRLKRTGFHIAHSDLNLKTFNEQNETVSNFSYESFQMEYAWQCLLSQGHKVTDQINDVILAHLNKQKDILTPIVFYRMSSVVADLPFFHFKSQLSSAIKGTRHLVEDNEKEELPTHYSMIRRMVLTPTKHVFLQKEPIVQNRIIRQYDEDYFIRIVFRDEDYERVSAVQPNTLDFVMEATKEFMRKGFQILDRHYEFLGCSNSQLREHGFWFFSPNEGITAQMIRDNCGQIAEERCIASYVSRFGLCFSASRDTVKVGVNPGEVIEDDDVERNGYCFTDGIGKISAHLAMKVSKELESRVVPSAFQIRFGGCKGVVSQDPTLAKETDVLVIRKSMKKFESSSNNLEILTVTSPGRLHLNRQVITLLSGLGIKDDIFMELQEEMLFSLADMMMYDKQALQALSAISIDIKFKDLKKSGVKFIKEPFFRLLLLTIYKSKIRDMMRRARIQLPFEKGRVMMGIVDETGILEYGQVFVQYSHVPGRQKEDVTVHRGTVVATKNPCFHPGDLRKFKAIDVPSLHHMVDCIVFPQNGPRPHPDEMSGSDLDGDVYFVCWDDRLCGIKDNQTPMHFPKAKKLELGRPINANDIINFVADYIKADSLGVIANAHVVHADKDKEGIYSKACIQLARLHSDAVDFPKTGKVPKMERDLRVESYPDFMMKRDKPQYRSKKILGKLFRQCRALEQAQTRRSGSHIVMKSIVPDEDLVLENISEYEEDAIVARNVYNEKLTQIMTLYGIESEAEAVSGVIKRLNPNRGCLRNEHYEVGQIVKAKMSVIRLKTRQSFFLEFGGETNIDFDDIDERVLIKASAWYTVTYCEENVDSLLSFPWIVADLLAIIKSRRKSAFQTSETDREQNETEEEEKFEDSDDAMLDIGSSLLNHFYVTKEERQLTMDSLIDFGRRVLNVLMQNPSLRNIVFVPIGTCVSGLMDTEDYSLQLGVVDQTYNRNKQILSQMINNELQRAGFSLIVIAPNPVYRYKIDGEDYYIRFSFDVNQVRRAAFLRDFVERNRVLLPVILFLLDWGRKTFVGQRRNDIFDETVFSMLILGQFLKMDVLSKRLTVPYPKVFDGSLNVDNMSLTDIVDMDKTSITLISNVLLKFLKGYRAFQTSAEGVIGYISDPSHHRQDRNLLQRPLSPQHSQSFINELLFAYQEIAERNNVDSFFGLVELQDEHLVLNLPLDTWDTLLFAEAYISRQLSKRTGAEINIRRTTFRDTKGIILEAWGTREQLWDVNKSLQDLGEKSSTFVSTVARNKAFIGGAYVSFYEGCFSLDDILQLDCYNGPRQEHHKDGKYLSVPKLLNVGKRPTPSLNLDAVLNFDGMEFQKIFLQQCHVVRENYDKTFHGILRLALTFGKFYIVDVEQPQISIKDLHDKLGWVNLSNRRANDSAGRIFRGRGRGRGRNRRNYSSFLHSSTTKKPRSSFIPCECKPDKIDIFLNQMGFVKDGKEKKYHVSLETGEADFGKRHTSLCVFDKDLSFLEFRLSDFKWFAGDIIRLEKKMSEEQLDVRCKLQSRRILDVNAVRTMEDVKSVLDPQTKVLSKIAGNIYISNEFKARVSFLREKQIDSFTYGGSLHDDSVWHDMKIKVAHVTEYSTITPYDGKMGNKVERTEVTVVPKLPDLNLTSDDELGGFAKKIWNLSLYLGNTFDS